MWRAPRVSERPHSPPPPPPARAAPHSARSQHPSSAVSRLTALVSSSDLRPGQALENGGALLGRKEAGP